MKDILTAGSIIVLEQYALSKVVVGFDFDGTLAPIVDNRRVAGMRRSTRNLLATLAKLYPCAVISGRARADVETRLDGVRLLAVVGNHGIESSFVDPKFAVETGVLLRQIAGEIERLQGVEIEDKRHSLSIHYRQARAKQLTRELIRDVLARLTPNAGITEGKCVINLMPAGAPNKGDSLRSLVAAERAQAAIYVGDDVTDESAFALSDPPVLGIRVSESHDSAAKYFVRDQFKVDDLLTRLVAIRAGGRYRER